MPIITVQLVGAEPSGIASEQVQALADALGDLFDIGPGETWVRLLCLPRQHYAENGVELAPEVQPTFVEVLKGDLPDPDALEAEAARVAATVAARLERPLENTHVLYLPPGIGRIAFGGRLVRA